MEALRHLHVKGAKLLNYQRVSREEPSCNVRRAGVCDAELVTEGWREAGRPMEATMAVDEPSGRSGEKRTINTLP